MLKSDIPKYARAIAPALDRAVQSVAKDIARDAKESAPVDTGDLRKSIKARKTGKGEARVEAGEWYAPLVEFGSSRKGARPFMGPAAEKWDSDALRDAVARELR